MSLFRNDTVQFVCSTTVVYTTPRGPVTMALGGIGITVEASGDQAELSERIKAAVKPIIIANAPQGTTNAHYSEIIADWR